MDEPKPGRFRIQTVARMTSISEATLRAWENRYQVPKPERTPSGYRIYDQESISQVRRMRALCEAGMSPAEAARVVTESAPTAAPPTPSPAQPASGSGRVRFMELISREQVGPQGTLSLGSLVALMERAAVVVTMRQLRQASTIVSSERVAMERYVAAGDLLEIEAALARASEERAEVQVEVWVEDLLTGERRAVTRCGFELVPAATHIDP